MDGGAIDPIRTDPNEALGAPQNDDTFNFVALGYGGELTLGFSPAVTNGPGNDIQVVETTFSNWGCDVYEETANVFVSQDGVIWLFAGNTCHDGFFDISAANPAWTHINFVKIVDVTSDESNSEDGYDVDGVIALNGCDDPSLENPPTGECYATDVLDYVEGTQQNTDPLAPARTNAGNALGAPQNDDTINFVTLGYDGSLTVSFNGAVPNGAGDDIQVVETSFGSPACGAYNETVDVSVSQDGLTYYYIGSVCLDGAVDISDAAVDLDYVIFVRLANNNGLTNTSDGYDVDAVIALHNCIEIDPASVDLEGENFMTVGEENQISLRAYPNPTKGEAVVSFSVPTTTFTSVEVFNMEGKSVATLFSQQAAADNVYTIDFNGTDLPNGIYVYRLTTDNKSVIEKFMIAR